MHSSVLVNSTWADIFNLVSSRDVYIPSAAFGDHFIHRACWASSVAQRNHRSRYHAPNLRRLSIEYVAAGFDDIFNRVGLAALPPQTTHLDVRYSFSYMMPTWLESLKEKQEKGGMCGGKRNG
ncbi:hypothetical protein K438DRAFT_1752722 [Mycena galopus ATCC 62051]|nr:hypothetical protein K438DRAFT_1752722 [Mycena galopus ATCC 62051]